MAHFESGFETVLLFALATTLLLLGCDKEVSRKRVGESHEITVTESCTHPGYCFSCMPGFDGKNSCSFKFSTLCPGSCTVRYLATPIEITYESGQVRKDEDRELIERGPCQ